MRGHEEPLWKGFGVTPSLETLTIGGESQPWVDAGFRLQDGRLRAGTVELRLGAGQGILGWRLSTDHAEIDGLPVAADDPGEAAAAEHADHPNGVTRIDHVVVFTPALERTTEALEAVGVERRRVREVEMDGGPLRQGFFRLGEVILEVVEHANVGDGPARFWGITFAVEDLDATAELLGERLGSVRDAVQPGRRIATIRKTAGLGLPVALISA